jgi:serine/threonine protein phosphatase PrpC
MTLEHEIKNNDIVVVGTDGLFDNIDENQIIDVIKPYLKGKESFADTAQVADGIAQLAYKVSLDR